MTPIRVHEQVEALHAPPPLVGADVRRLTLSQRVLPGKDQSLVTSAPTLDWEVQGPNARPRNWRSGLPMNRPHYLKKIVFNVAVAASRSRSNNSHCGCKVEIGTSVRSLPSKARAATRPATTSRRCRYSNSRSAAAG